METAQIAELLSPFVPPNSLSQHQLDQLLRYLEVLIRWNVRTNLTAVRDRKSIVLRHFGESLFAARHLLTEHPATKAIDLGSGAGFPGVPLKIYAPAISVTLIESQNKKATFLKEVIRTLGLQSIQVHNGRAEHFAGRAELVTLRAVESFDSVLPIAASLLQSGGNCRLGLLIGEAQVNRAQELRPKLAWSEPIPIPRSANRILLVGTQQICITPSDGVI